MDDGVVSDQLANNNVKDSVNSSLTMRARNRMHAGFHRGPQYCGAVHSVGFAEEANHRFRPTMEVGDSFSCLSSFNRYRTPISSWTSLLGTRKTPFLESTMDTVDGQQ